MKIKFTPFTYEQLNQPVSYSMRSIASILDIRRLTEVYHLHPNDAKAIVDDCCLNSKPLMSHLAPLMESNPELFI